MAQIRIRAAILGASGYTGAEALRLLFGHPYVEVAALAGESQAGKAIGEVFPHLPFSGLPDLISMDQVDYADIDAAICCLPHGVTQEVVAKIPAHVRVIDVSADFRLRDPDIYAQWYGHPHQALALQQQAVYGLTEHYREEIRKARLVACPGCYPTSALLPLIPLLQEGLIAPEGIVIDAKSGVTGAGRAAKQANLFTEVNEGLAVYGVGHHRHTPEIEQELSLAADTSLQIRFTPHLTPMNRGILSTIYVRLAEGASTDDLRENLARRYENEPFVHVLPEGGSPSTHQVRGSNHCMIGVFADRVAGHAILVSAIDNLVKGASGQAVQNLNVMFGLEETSGLRQTALFP